MGNHTEKHTETFVGLTFGVVTGPSLPGEWQGVITLVIILSGTAYVVVRLAMILVELAQEKGLLRRGVRCVCDRTQSSAPLS
jgi:hypothetical protein